MDNNHIMKLDDDFKKLVDSKLKAGEPVEGMTFINKKGSVGTILPGLSVKGKLLASMTCVLGGPNHVRERSDWFQCSVSPEKAKTTSKKVKTNVKDIPQKPSELNVMVCTDVRD